MNTTTHPTIAEQLRGHKIGTRFLITTAGSGRPTTPDRSFRWIEANRGGCAVFDPSNVREDYFLPLDSRGFALYAY